MLDKIKQFVKFAWHGDGPSSPYYIPAAPDRSIRFKSIADLADALTRAKDAHAQFERGLGRPDTNWPLWYAGHMAMEQGLLGRACCGTVQVTQKFEKADMHVTPDHDYASRH